MHSYDHFKQFSTRELLSLTIRESPDSQVIDNLSDLIQSPNQLIDCTLQELMNLQGIGEKKALQLKASLELGRRVYQAPIREITYIKNPNEVVNYLEAEMRYLDREHFREILLNRKNGILAIETISIGGLSSSLVHPREVFKPAIKKSAASIILVHNHPSGDPSPSGEDIEITKRLAESGSLLGIEILDHIIIGDARWTSLKSSGLF